MTDDGRINDAMMADVTGGGDACDMEGGRTVEGIIMFDPFPNNPEYSGVWDDCMAQGLGVYRLSDGVIAVADSHVPYIHIGDRVLKRWIRRYYGWEIEPVVGK